MLIAQIMAVVPNRTFVKGGPKKRWALGTSHTINFEQQTKMQLWPILEA